jgi:hypothetical protein
MPRSPTLDVVTMRTANTSALTLKFGKADDGGRRQAMSYDSIFVNTGVSRQSELMRLATPLFARCSTVSFAKQQS